MRPLSRTLLIALGLAAATPALAARPYYQPSYRSLFDNALRLQVGGASLSSPGIYCPSGSSGPCYDDSPFAWQALYLGGDVDVSLGGGPIALTVGARELAAPYYSGNPNIFEPSVGVSFRFVPRAPVEPRLMAGLGLLVASDGSTGGSLRLGGGLSFGGRGPLGLAVDLVFDLGELAGYRVTQVQLAVGPEFRF